MKNKLPAIHSKPTLSTVDRQRTEALYSKVSEYIEIARYQVQRAVNGEMIKAYWKIGKEIVEEEQHGKSRAAYGKTLLLNLASRLTERYGRGFSVRTLEDIRKFYLTYPIDTTDKKSHAVRENLSFNANLSWTHYRLLMRIERNEARSFYGQEAIKNNWSARELERQIGSLLFDRLAKSKDKDGLIKLACQGQEIIKPEDAIKDPLILEFLNLPESHQLVESKLEDALISNLQHFLLELGSGFAFIARQKRLSLEGDHFYADLVFYHVILKCYVIIDIKTHKLTHADLGQIQLYVNYYDEKVKAESDNPTIGLILCTKKNDTMVKYTLGEKAKHIFASKYQFHLPTEAQLEAELKRELEEFQHSSKQK